MTDDKNFTCPACGAEFDVSEQLEEIDRGASERTEPSPAGPTAVLQQAAEPVSFQCAACGADYETSEALTDATR